MIVGEAVAVAVAPGNLGIHGGDIYPVCHLHAKAGPTGNAEIPVNPAFAAMAANAGKARCWGGCGGIGDGGI